MRPTPQNPDNHLLPQVALDLDKEFLDFSNISQSMFFSCLEVNLCLCTQYFLIFVLLISSRREFMRREQILRSSPSFLLINIEQDSQGKELCLGSPREIWCVMVSPAILSARTLS